MSSLLYITGELALFWGAIESSFQVLCSQYCKNVPTLQGKAKASEQISKSVSLGRSWQYMQKKLDLRTKQIKLTRLPSALTGAAEGSLLILRNVLIFTSM